MTCNKRSHLQRKMNIQQPTTNTMPPGGVANTDRASASADRFRPVTLPEVSAESRRSTSPPLTRAPANAMTVFSTPSTERCQAASGVRDPSPAPKEEISSSFPAPTEHLATSSSSRTFSLAPSVISKASRPTLSSQKDKFTLRPDDIEAKETMRPDDAHTSINETDLREEAKYSSPSSSSTSTNEFHETDGSLSVPAYIAYTTPSAAKSTESIFAARRNELHFFSGVFRQYYQDLFQGDDDDDLISDDDDDLISDDEDSDEDRDNYHQHRCVEYSGRTSFVKRKGAYRKSHEIGPLLFANTLDLDDANSNDTTDSDVEE